MKIILASKSPRRRELMSLLADNFITESPDVEENEDESLSPCDFVCSLAKQKADAPEASIKASGPVLSM